MHPELNKPLLTFARAVHAALLNNPAFPSPNPPLDVFAADIAAFEDAETKAASRAKGAASIRDARKKKVKEDLFHLRDYVQSVVETDTSPATAAALIESAFMSVRKVRKRTLSDLSAKNADVSGKALLTAKAVAPVAVYSWEHSLVPIPELRVPRWRRHAATARLQFGRHRQEPRGRRVACITRCGVPRAHEPHRPAIADRGSRQQGQRTD
jgi:hypothetical protein